MHIFRECYRGTAFLSNKLLLCLSFWLIEGQLFSS